MTTPWSRFGHRDGAAGPPQPAMTREEHLLQLSRLAELGEPLRPPGSEPPPDPPPTPAAELPPWGLAALDNERGVFRCYWRWQVIVTRGGVTYRRKGFRTRGEALRARDDLLRCLESGGKPGKGWRYNRRRRPLPLPGSAEFARRLERIRVMLAAGLTTREIARALGMDRSSVRRLRRRRLGVVREH